MAFRNIIVESPAAISLRREQLIIRTDSEHSVPIEDISALLLESRQTTITTAALSRLGQRGCAVFTCDEKHLPCAPSDRIRFPASAGTTPSQYAERL